MKRFRNASWLSKMHLTSYSKTLYVYGLFSVSRVGIMLHNIQELENSCENRTERWRRPGLNNHTKHKVRPSITGNLHDISGASHRQGRQHIYYVTRLICSQTTKISIELTRTVTIQCPYKTDNSACWMKANTWHWLRPGSAQATSSTTREWQRAVKQKKLTNKQDALGIIIKHRNAIP